jgi:hypothetical protein
VAQAGRKGQLPLGDIKSGLRVAKEYVAQTRCFFVRSIAHRRMVTVKVKCSHKLESFKGGPGGLHCIYSRLTIAWIKLHSPTCEGKQFDPEIFLKGIQRGIFNTVIGS